MLKVSKAALAVASVVLVLTLTPSVLRAGTAVRMTVPDLVDRAELVFEGRVLNAYALEDARGRIVTEYFVTVDQTYWGAPLGTRTFRLPGGVLPTGKGMIVPGMPDVRVGEDAIFFLTEESAVGHRMPVGLAQGKFRLVKDPLGETLLERDQEGLVLADPLTGAVLPAEDRLLSDYDTVVETIRTAVVARSARARSAPNSSPIQEAR